MQHVPRIGDAGSQWTNVIDGSRERNDAVRRQFVISGLSPTMPQAAAGMRMEPPVSVPSVAMAMPVATLTADPPLDPPR